jgi:hypothetical protein
MLRADLIRYRAMYATSMILGWATVAVFAIVHVGAPVGAGAAVRRNAHHHAANAARKRGPYLAPITLLAVAVAILAGLIGVLL